MATMADDKDYTQQGGQNFYSFYQLHNYHPLLYAAMLLGHSQAALEVIYHMEATITEDMLCIELPPIANWVEFFKSVHNPHPCMYPV